MANINYNLLFQVRLTHNFNANGICRNDFRIVPSPETSKIMESYKLVFREDEQGFRVYYKANSDNSSFIALSNLNLCFALYLINTNRFLNVTNLKDGELDYGFGRKIFFSNRGNVGEHILTYSLIYGIGSKKFIYNVPAIMNYGNEISYGSPVFDVVDASETSIGTRVLSENSLIVDENGHYHLECDFSSFPAGKYGFYATDNAEYAGTEYFYIDNDLAREEVFGLIDLKVNSVADASFPDNTPSSQPAAPIPAINTSRIYHATFSRKEGTWKYIIVHKSGMVQTSNPIAITDSNYDNNQSQQLPYPHPLSFNNAGATTGTYNGFPAKFIASVDDDLPFYEIPKKELTLKKYPNGSQSSPSGTPLELVSSLPGMAIDRVNSSLVPNIYEIIIYI